MCNSFHYCAIPPYQATQLLKTITDPELQKVFRKMKRNATKYRKARKDTEPSSAFKPLPRVARGMKNNKKREVYEYATQSLLQKENGAYPTGDEEVDRAYNFAGIVYDFFFQEFRRDSITGAGDPIISTVRWEDCNAAFYPESTLHRKGELRLGKGDGEIYRSFAQDLSMYGHEYMHGVIHYSGGIDTGGQAGSLHESIADVFGSLVMQYYLRQEAHQASWLMGENLLIPHQTEKPIGIRSLKSPGSAYRNHPFLGDDPQPWHMEEYDRRRARADAHYNCGIPNHAFYLLAIQLGGYAWEKAGQIWYNALEKVDRSMKNLSFRDWARLTIDTAIQLYGADSQEAILCKRCWMMVGVLKR